MVQWLHDGDETNASFYAGVLVSAYAFGEVLTAVLWGYISDKVGRKPIVLIGLCGVALSCIMFGLAKSYWVALVARLIGGMLNGNVAVMQTMLAEMIKNPKHERELRCADTPINYWLTLETSHCLRHPPFRVVRWRYPRVCYGRLPC
jgi:MFS family permease